MFEITYLQEIDFTFSFFFERALRARSVFPLSLPTRQPFMAEMGKHKRRKLH